MEDLNKKEEDILKKTVLNIMDLLDENKEEEARALFNKKITDNIFSKIVHNDKKDLRNICDLTYEINMYLNNEGAKNLNWTSKARIKEMFKLFKSFENSKE